MHKQMDVERREITVRRSNCSGGIHGTNRKLQRECVKCEQFIIVIVIIEEKEMQIAKLLTN
jgi:hypothetical protein